MTKYDKEGYVYVGLQVNWLTGERNYDYRKIGLTNNIKTREKQLNKTNSPWGYQMIRAWRTDGDTEKLENYLHEMFKRVRCRHYETGAKLGEWFHEPDVERQAALFLESHGKEEVDLIDEGDLTDGEKDVIIKNNEKNHKEECEFARKEILSWLNDNNLAVVDERHRSADRPIEFKVAINDIILELGIYKSGKNFWLQTANKQSTDAMAELVRDIDKFSIVDKAKRPIVRIGEKGTKYAEDLDDLFDKINEFKKVIKNEKVAPINSSC